MKVVAISGSIVGSKTKIAVEHAVKMMKNYTSETEIQLLNLADYQLEFSDGRPYFEYRGDTKYVLETIMGADVILIGTPVFQASIPGTLKNLFDLLPIDALRDKVVSILVTAGSAKHYLMVEQQLKPILTYMKAHIVQEYVFIEEADFLGEKIINDDVIFRLERLVENTIMTTKAFSTIREEQKLNYDF